MTVAAEPTRGDSHKHHPGQRHGDDVGVDAALLLEPSCIGVAAASARFHHRTIARSTAIASTSSPRRIQRDRINPRDRRARTCGGGVSTSRL